MPDVSFNSLAVILTVAFLAPLVLGLFPRVRLPARSNPSTAAAFVAAGLVSALVFPAAGLTLLRRDRARLDDVVSDARTAH